MRAPWAVGAAVTASLCLLPELSVAQVTGLDLRGYYLNVATGSLEGPFTPAGVTDFQRLRLSTSPEFGEVGLDVAYEQGLQLYTDSELGGLPFASLGATESLTQWLPLQGTIAEGDHARWTNRVDRCP